MTTWREQAYEFRSALSFEELSTELQRNDEKQPNSDAGRGVVVFTVRENEHRGFYLLARYERPEGDLRIRIFFEKGRYLCDATLRCDAVAPTSDQEWETVLTSVEQLLAARAKATELTRTPPFD